MEVTERARVMPEKTAHIELSDWERRKLASHAGASYLTYAGHFENGIKLSEHEIAEMERWKALAAKLAKRH